MQPARTTEKATGRYVRTRPEETLLYKLIEQHYPAFVDYMAAQGRGLPHYVQREFDDYVKCGRLKHGFLRVRCDSCHAEHLVAFSCKRRGFYPSCGARRMAESAALLVDEVLPEKPMRQWVLSFPYQLRFLFASYPVIMSQVLAIVYRVIAGHLIKHAGFTQKTAKTGAITLIQRFGSALNLNVHFHMLFLEGVYAEGSNQPTCFYRTRAPEPEELARLVHTISHRVARCLERKGLLVCDAESSYLQLNDMEEDAMQQLHGRSISYRIAVGPQQGLKVFTLQALPAVNSTGCSERVAKEAGFSLQLV